VRTTVVQLLIHITGKHTEFLTLPPPEITSQPKMHATKQNSIKQSTPTSERKRLKVKEKVVMEQDKQN